MSPELVLWLDGRWVSEKEAKVSIFDDGFLRGDAVFDVARTFGGKPFQLREHVDRLLESCRYLMLDPGLGRAELIALGEEVAAKNTHLVSRYGDFWIDYHVTRGVRREGFETRTSLMVYCDPIPFRERAPLYRDGIEVTVSGVRRTPPWAISPRVKTHNYMNFVLAGLGARSRPGAWPILLDEHGNLTEGASSNIFLVKDGELLTPLEQFVLPGISRRTVMMLAGKLGIPVREKNLDPRDLCLADEVFLTSTSLCLCPVGKIDGRAVPGAIPGAITARLLAAYNELAGADIRAQYLSFL